MCVCVCVCVCVCAQLRTYVHRMYVFVCDHSLVADSSLSDYILLVEI